MQDFTGYWQQITEAISGRVKKREKNPITSRIYMGTLSFVVRQLLSAWVAWQHNSDILVTKYPKWLNFCWSSWP